MTPRYQIFISSTFRDLKKERQAALDAILELGHFPAGMEVFPAADATPWTVIEAIITESDYYIVIIGGTYGSTDNHGISYTEREYDLALSKGIPVLAFLHKDPLQIPAGMSELDPDTRRKLAEFRTKVERHHCKYWMNADELKAQIVVGIAHAIRVSPRVGWIRGDQGDSAETLKKLNVALEENAGLRNEIRSLRDAYAVRASFSGELAAGSDRIVLGFKSEPHKDWRISASWDDLLRILGPHMLSDTSEWNLFFTVSPILARIVSKEKLPADPGVASVDSAQLIDDDFFKVIYQFLALESIEPVTIVDQRTVFDQLRTDRSNGYRLTKLGAQTLGRLNAMKRNG